MKAKGVLAVALLPTLVAAQTAAQDAAAFGAREAVSEVSLSPDGTKIAFVSAAAGQASTLFTLNVGSDAPPKAALSVSGKPDRLSNCHWVSNARLVCTVWGLVKAPDVTRPLSYSRKFAVDAVGGHQMMLTQQRSSSSMADDWGTSNGPLFFGGSIVDWLPGADGKVLMTSYVRRTDNTGSQIGSTREGLALDRVDTTTGQHQSVEAPRLDGDSFITDGLGNVRILGFQAMNRATYQSSSVTRYSYRPKGGRDVLPLATFDNSDGSGFLPVAVDPKADVAYGFRKTDGRYAVFTKSLDGSGTEKLVLARPDVDVDSLVQIGRDQRIVGASFATDRRQITYFDPEIAKVTAALHRALPGGPTVNVVDASLDDSKWLIVANSDTDPGRYYLFDRATKKLQILMEVRPQLSGRSLGTVKAITFPAADGTPIPAYLTLPPSGSAKGLPAIVLPHGGPSSRDEWGFDWLSQFFVARGYAVLQPEYRGSSGYGDKWFRNQGFRQWRVAIDDVAQAGRWLVSQGIADPQRLAIVGWSYGGYAALQSAAVQPDLFKAVVAIAPVTDLATLRDESIGGGGLIFSGYRQAANFIGSGPHLIEGSPAQNAARIKAPVLLFHGSLDANVTYPESTLMAGKLRGAGKQVELVTFPGLDHQLEDGAARTQMLEKSDAFIRAAIGEGQRP